MRARLLLIGVALLGAACGKDTATSPSTTTSATSTERFDAILSPRGTAFYSFVVAENNGTVAINLASLSPIDRPGLLPVAMQIGYGVPAGEGCDVQKSILTAPGLTSQLTATLRDGTYCAAIADVGNLKEPANYSIRITHQ
jgi:hypothetical protein